MPASLPEGAPALVLAVPDAGAAGLAGVTAEIATVLRVDNPALDVRTARIDQGGRGDPAGIRAVLADAGLARADRVRMFSITTSADGIILATVGGEEAVGTASVTAFLLAARLALPVMAASLDAKPSIEDAAVQLEGMGVTRIALAPCVIGPEADPAAIEEAAAVIGAKCCAPLGAHGNVVKLISLAYGQVLNQLKPSGPDASVSPPGGRHR